MTSLFQRPQNPVLCDKILTFTDITTLHFYSRQIEKLTDQRVQQSISSGQKMKEVRQDGEKKISRMKQQLEDEQEKSKQREIEIAELRRFVYCTFLAKT